MKIVSNQVRLPVSWWMCVFIASKEIFKPTFFVGMYTLCIGVNGRWVGQSAVRSRFARSC